MAIGKISEELKSAQDYLFNDATVTANARAVEQKHAASPR